MWCIKFQLGVIKFRKGLNEILFRSGISDDDIEVTWLDDEGEEGGTLTYFETTS